MTRNKRNTAEKNLYFLIKNCNLSIPRPPQRTSKEQEKPSALKRQHPTPQKMKFNIKFVLFLWVILSHLIRIQITPERKFVQLFTVIHSAGEARFFAVRYCLNCILALTVNDGVYGSLWKASFEDWIIHWQISGQKMVPLTDEESPYPLSMISHLSEWGSILELDRL